MRGQEFRARDKKVQKMTRDGLTEKNLTAGTEQRISGRLADVSFGHERKEDTAAGHRAKSRTQKTMRGTGAPVRGAGKVPEGRNKSKAAQRSLPRERITEEENRTGRGKCRRKQRCPICRKKGIFLTRTGQNRQMPPKAGQRAGNGWRQNSLKAAQGGEIRAAAL